MLVRRVGFCILGVVFAWATAARGASDSVLLLYTNDIHDHVRPGYDGIGGMAYIVEYINTTRASRADTLVLDAGDVMEKGDLVAFETQSRVVYEAMGRTQYDAGTLGNHDDAYGADHAKACADLAHMALLCANYVDANGAPVFEPSRMFDVDGVRVGVIGLAVPKGAESCLDMEASARIVAAEADRLDQDAHLIVVLCHMGSADCRRMSPLVPTVDVFVSGHTHEAIREPIVVDGTGALIVQAGQYACYVGRLELRVDLETEAVTRVDGRLVEMRHGEAPCDEATAAWIAAREREVCPEATRIVGHADKALGFGDIGCLSAEALRLKVGADVAFCHPGQIIRSQLPQGNIDVNALFLTGGQRGHDLIESHLTGAAITTYLDGLMAFEKGPTEWAGFHARSKRVSPAAPRTYDTDLEADRVYRVVMPGREWETRFLSVMEKYARGNDARAAIAKTDWRAEPCAFSFIEALTEYIEALNRPIDARLKELVAAQQLP